MLLATKVIVCDTYLAPVPLLFCFDILNIELKPRGWQTYVILSIVIFYSLLLGAGVETAVCSFFRTANAIVVRNWKAVETDLGQQDCRVCKVFFGAPHISR